MKRFTTALLILALVALLVPSAADARGTFRETEILASASRTADDESALVDSFGGRGLHSVTSPQAGCRLYLDVSAESGTSPTLDVTIEAVVSGVDFVIATFTQATGITKQTVTALECPEDLKAVWVFGGTDTPTFTFEVNVTRY